MNKRTTCTRTGLTVSKEFQPKERILKYVDIQPTQTPNCHDPLSCKTIAYSANALRAIWDNHQHDQQFKVLPFGAVRKIRELRINCKPTKHNNNRPGICQHGCNTKNLRNLLNAKTNSTCNIIGGTCNVQSLKAKELLVSELIKDYLMDFIVATESWLSDKTDKQWYKNTEFKHNGLKLYNVNRRNRKVGGLVRIAKSQYKVSECKSGATRSFEYATWRLLARGAPINITTIYHPPYLLKNNCTYHVPG